MDILLVRRMATVMGTVTRMGTITDTTDTRIR
jgi:hypothetical protein